ncbi:FAD binding domain-containing protein [Amycolatopsis sp. cmx-4-83]|uniref:FAD binding domain-containing protein n=1 Tax=Amycolatopsis sp. cmx-4-83 TaxID=2790940 RepID=UPI00397C2FBC
MKPAPFDYHAPASLAEAVALLGARPGTRVLAGGQSLLRSMSSRTLCPPALVDLRALPGLDRIERAPGRIVVGARVTQRAAEDADCPLLRRVLPFVGHPQTRGRGTVVGSVVHADPGAELPAALLAVDGVVHAYGPGGTRRIAAADFFRGPFTTALAPDEIATAVELPVPAGAGCAEVAGCGAVAATDRAGVRLALFGVGDRPRRAYHAERAWRSGGDFPAAVREDLAGVPDGYPREVAPALLRRALADVR